MREYAKKPESQSRTLDSNPKASRQAPIDVILQRYKERNIQRFAEDEELIQGKFETTQCEAIDEDELLQGKFEPLPASKQETIQREEKPNNTGLPDNLKTGIENLSGYSMDDVKVYYNSNKTVQLQALAFTQGTDIHVAPGQEKHLPHEAWHVVQQKQGRVQPTMQMQGVNVNDNEALEHEADVMGGKVLSMRTSYPSSVIQKKEIEKMNKPINLTVQRLVLKDEEGEPMTRYNTDDLLLFEQSLNVIHLTEENPIVFITLLINQLKEKARKGDENIDKALSLCRGHRIIQSRGDMSLDKVGLEEVMSVNEFDDLIRDCPIVDKDLPKLVVDAKNMAVTMEKRIASIVDMDASPVDKMKYMTDLGDAIMNQVMHESVILLGQPSYGMAVYATGGFGRGETSPGSDLDFGVIGDDKELPLIRSLTNMMQAKINLARGLMAKSLGLEDDVKPALEADPLWLQSNKSVSPEEVIKASANKGTPEDARLSTTLPGADMLIKRFDRARTECRDPKSMEKIFEIVGQYNIPELTEGKIYNIKEGWLRMITLSMQKIGGTLGLCSTGTLERFAEMVEKKILDPEFAEKLKFAFITLMGIRQKLHGAYKGEKDEFYTGVKPPIGIESLPYQSYVDLISVSETLRLFNKKLLIFAKTGGKDGLRPQTKAEKIKTFFGF